MRELYDLLMGHQNFLSSVKHSTKTYNEFENIVEEGSNHNGFYLILKGKVRIRLQLGAESRDQMSVIDLSAGDTFGEIGLFYRAPASATVITLQKAEILEIDIPTFEKYLDEHPDM